MAISFRSRIYRTYGLLKTFGFRYTCPMCGWHARTFYAAGFSYPVLETYHVVSAGRRDNVRCPRCNSSSRERLTYLYLTRLFPAFGTGRVLHVAPEPKMESVLRLTYPNRYVSLDIDQRRADVVASVEDIPFPNDSFDLLLCAHVLEHVPDDRKALREFARVLTPDGTALLLVPFSPVLSETFEDWSVTEEKDRERVFGQSDHVRIYGMDFTKRIAESGLAVRELYAADFLSPAEVARYALDSKEPLFVCEKAT